MFYCKRRSWSKYSRQTLLAIDGLFLLKLKKKKIKGPVLPTKLFNALLYFERVNGLYKDILIRIIKDINMLITIDIPRVKKIFNNKRNSSIKSLITE